MGFPHLSWFTGGEHSFGLGKLTSRLLPLRVHLLSQREGSHQKQSLYYQYLGTREQGLMTINYTTITTIPQIITSKHVITPIHCFFLTIMIVTPRQLTSQVDPHPQGGSSNGHDWFVCASFSDKPNYHIKWLSLFCPTSRLYLRSVSPYLFGNSISFVRPILI